MRPNSWVFLVGLCMLMQLSWSASCSNEIIPVAPASVSANARSLPIFAADGRIWFVNKGKRVDLEAAIDLLDQSSNKIGEADDSGAQFRGIDHNRIIEVTSLVGQFASARIVDVWSSGERPFGSARFQVVDIDKPNEKVSLLKLFRDEDILRSFAESKDEVLSAAGQRVIKEGGTSGEIVAFGLSDNFLSEFTFTAANKKCVIVSFLINSLGHGDGLDNDAFYSIGLPIPLQLKRSLTKAANLTGGFLSSNRSKIGFVRVERHTGG